MEPVYNLFWAWRDRVNIVQIVYRACQVFRVITLSVVTVDNVACFTKLLVTRSIASLMMVTVHLHG